MNTQNSYLQIRLFVFTYIYRTEYVALALNKILNVTEM